LEVRSGGSVSGTVLKGRLSCVIDSTVLAGQKLGIKQVDDGIRLVSFTHYDLRYFDDETCRLEPLANPFGPKVLPVSSL
jgi:putative transposase